MASRTRGSSIPRFTTTGRATSLQVIHQSNVRLALNLHAKNLRLDPLEPGNVATPIVKSRHDSADDGEILPPMPVIDPSELIGCTFLMDKQDGQQHHAQILNVIDEEEICKMLLSVLLIHEEGTTNKFRGVNDRHWNLSVVPSLWISKTDSNIMHGSSMLLMKRRFANVLANTNVNSSGNLDTYNLFALSMMMTMKRSFPTMS
jgi:hypothetical protein